jgi:hypothetical protein
VLSETGQNFITQDRNHTGTTCQNDSVDVICNNGRILQYTMDCRNDAHDSIIDSLIKLLEPEDRRERSHSSLNVRFLIYQARPQDTLERPHEAPVGALKVKVNSGPSNVKCIIPGFKKHGTW